MKAVYGEAQYNASSQPNWSVIAKRPRFVTVPFQGPNECGHYALKFAATYDGEKVVENIQNNDVSYSSAFPCCLLAGCLFHFPVIIFIIFFCLQPRIVDWNAEYLYSIVFNPSNQILVTELPGEIQALAPGA
jgi:hypothetical protein